MEEGQGDGRDYMYKSEFKARAELSAESDLVLEVELPPTAPKSDERCEDRDVRSRSKVAIGFAIVLLRSAAHSTDVLSSFSEYPHISRPIRLVLSPVAELLQTRYSATHASQTRLFLKKQIGRPSTSCVVTPLLFVSCTVKGHA
jgi:hypothetical protein